MSKSKVFYEQLGELERQVLTAIRSELKQKENGKFIFPDTWEDDAGNAIESIDSENVYFDSTQDYYLKEKYFEMEAYPLEELGLNDSIYILSELEKV